MPGQLPTVTAGEPTYARDFNNVVGALMGSVDVGQVQLAPPVSAPGAPGVSLTSGSLTGTYQWCAWWVTGALDGQGNPHVVGTTPAGSATSAQSLSSQAAVISAPANPPETAIGFGIGRTKAGGSTFYVVATVYVNTSGTWPQYTDNTPDSSLSTPVPATNTTGTILMAPSISQISALGGLATQGHYGAPCVATAAYEVGVGTSATATTVTLAISYSDAGGAQTDTVLSSTSLGVGSYGYSEVYEATTALAIAVSASAGAASAVYATCTIEGVA
jgi:hypothetical protein